MATAMSARTQRLETSCKVVTCWGFVPGLRAKTAGGKSEVSALLTGVSMMSSSQIYGYVSSAARDTRCSVWIIARKLHPEADTKDLLWATEAILNGRELGQGAYG